MKKSILLFFATFATLVASAQTKVEIDGIWYNLDENYWQAEVTFKGSSYDEYEEYSDAINIPATVTYGGVEYSVTSIGSCAFSECSSLTDITIPENVTFIGWQVFQGCSNLTTITVEDGNYIYDSRDECNAIIASSSNTLIAGCSTTIIPESVTSIGDDAFINCTKVRLLS